MHIKSGGFSKFVSRGGTSGACANHTGGGTGGGAFRADFAGQFGRAARQAILLLQLGDDAGSSRDQQDARGERLIHVASNEAI